MTTAQTRATSIRITLLATVISGLIVFALSSLLFTRAALSERQGTRAPTPVAVTAFSEQVGYDRKISFLGLIEARRKADLGFEFPGLIAQVHVREGSIVQAGDVLASLDTATLETRQAATTAALQRANSELELAHIKANRQRDLRESGAVSREAFDETRLIAQARQAEVNAVQAQLRTLDVELQKSVIRAPYTGVVAGRYVDEGSVVNPGTPIVRLLESHDSEAHIGVAVEFAALLESGREYTLLFQNLPILAKLRSVRPDVNPATRATTAVFQLPSELKVLDGETITLVLSTSIVETGGWLPISALIEGERGIWNVLRLEPQGDVYLTLREIVEVLEIQGSRAYVRGTITEGDLIIESGVNRITPGVPVVLAER